MIQENRGFTLIELMAVIAILAVVIIVATTSISGVMKSARENTAKEMRENLKDVGITYVLEEFYLQKCSENFSDQMFNDRNISNYSSNTDCAKMITVSTLKSEGLFEDEKGYCKDSDYIIVYRYNVGDNSEYKAYANDTVCTNY